MNCFTFERNTRQHYNHNLCLFRSLALLLHRNDYLEEEAATISKFFLDKFQERDPSKSQSAELDNVPKVGDILQLNKFLYDFDFLVVELVDELAPRSVEKFDKSVSVLR